MYKMSCRIKGCGRLVNNAGRIGLCGTHYQRLKIHGNVFPRKPVRAWGQRVRTCKTPEYLAWYAAKYRCTSKKSHAWKNYGGRGITFCARWMNSFETFLKDMGKRPSNNHSLDRKNNDRGYSPSNCRWVTWKIQTSNKRPWNANRS